MGEYFLNPLESLPMLRGGNGGGDKTKGREMVTVMLWFDWFDKYKQLDSLLELTDPCKTQ